jgi:hypothetical protein
LELVSEFPFIAGEDAGLIFEVHLCVELIDLIVVVAFVFEVEFPKAHGESCKLGGGRLETDLLAVVKEDVVPA